MNIIIVVVNFVPMCYYILVKGIFQVGSVIFWFLLYFVSVIAVRQVSVRIKADR